MFLAVVFALILALAQAAPGPFDSFYVDTGRADGAKLHPITFYVKEKAEFIASCGVLLDEISTPGSPKFQQQYSFDDLKQFADEEGFESVRAFAVRHFGADRVQVGPNHDLVMVPDATVAEVEAAFNVALHDFQHVESKQFVARRPLGGAAQLPEDVREHVYAVSGLNHLPYHRAGQTPLLTKSPTAAEFKAIAKNEKRQMQGVATPQLLWRYYGVHNRTMASKQAKNSIFAALGQSFAPSDLIAWQRQFNLPATKISQVIGPNSPQGCAFNPNGCVEASLDVQQITSTAQLGDTTFHAIDQSVQDIFLAWIQAVNQEPNAPLVNSISYGSLATEDPKNDMEAFSTAACKAGLRGITVVVASGDDGVANFQARGDPSQCGFTPSYPATVPYVLAVGATQGPEEGQQEIVCSSATGGGITSGGGFSDIFNTPTWQKNTVKNYLQDQENKNQLPPTGQFNRFGRAYPDIAAMGHNYEISVGGQFVEGSGTSASTPVMAAMLSLLNGQRLAAGKTPLGFINPTLYSTLAQNPAKYFHQITSGDNKCTASTVCCQYGFYATSAHGSWSPTVGWGSPRFPAWEEYFVQQMP